MKKNTIFWQKINNNKKMFWRIMWVICLVVFLILFLIRREYAACARYYNAGNGYYRLKMYDTAENYYKQALWEKHTKGQECKIRINLALSIVKPITPMAVNADNLDEMIERLEYAIEILVENDCAHMDDSNGHNRKAQTLKEEIEAYIEELKKNNPPEENKSEKDEEEQKKQNQQNKQNQSQQEEQKKKEQEERERKEREEKEAKQKELREIMDATEKQGEEQRNRALQTYEDSSYFWSSEDKSW